jgi:hypothetical protein
MRSRMTRRELFCKWACACARYPDHSSEVGKDVGNVPLSWETRDMVGESRFPPVFFRRGFYLVKIQKSNHSDRVPDIFGNRLDPGLIPWVQRARRNQNGMFESKMVIIPL